MMNVSAARHITCLAVAAAMLLNLSCRRSAPAPGTLYHCDKYTLTTDSVIVNGKTMAKALSDGEIVSVYEHKASAPISNEVYFTFLINGDTPEFADSTKRHRIKLTPENRDDSIVFTYRNITRDENLSFGSTVSANTLLDSKFTFRVDMSRVFEAFSRDDYFSPFPGDTIRAKDFKGVWIYGADKSIDATVDDPQRFDGQKMTYAGDSIFEITVTLNPDEASARGTRIWRGSGPHRQYPEFTSGMTLIDALYNMAIDNIAKDSTAIYSPRSIIFAMGFLDPERARESLMAQVRNGRIIPTGETAWPVNGRTAEWILAAWELYCVTGNREWAEKAYEIGRRSLEVDEYVSLSDIRKLFKGGLVSLDRRNAYYPSWMSVVDIYSSISLVNNACYCRAYDIMASLAEIVGDDGEKYMRMSGSLRDCINLYFWLPSQGYYSQYLYGSFPIASPFTDNMGQALCISYQIATSEMASRVFEKTTVTHYGIPAMAPLSPDLSAGYAGCVRPDYQACWNMAAARSRNMGALEAGLGAQFRAAACLAGEPVLLNALTGDEMTRYANVDEQLSASARLSAYYRILAGMEFTPEGLTFHPVIPQSYTGTKVIKGLRYRDATLSIAITGTGTRISAMTLDDEPVDDFTVNGDLNGAHHIKITMANDIVPEFTNNIENKIATAPAAPTVVYSPSGSCFIKDYSSNFTYNVYINGAIEEPCWGADYYIYDMTRFNDIAIDCTSHSMISGYTARQHYFIPRDALYMFEADSFAVAGTRLIGDTSMAGRVVECSSLRNTHLSIDFEAPADGDYLVDVYYGNGAGPVYSQNGCAMRTLLVNGKKAGVIVMPQTGEGKWKRFTFSNAVKVSLKQGLNSLSLDYVVPYDINVNDNSANTVLIDYIRLLPLQ